MIIDTDVVRLEEHGCIGTGTNDINVYYVKTDGCLYGVQDNPSSGPGNFRTWYNDTAGSWAKTHPVNLTCQIDVDIPTPTPTANEINSTTLSVQAVAGSTTLQVADQQVFQPGDRIVIAESTTKQEFHTVQEYGSIIIQQPLQYTHDVGTIITKLNTIPSFDLDQLTTSEILAIITASEGDAYYATDTDEMYVWNGSNWSVF